MWRYLLLIFGVFTSSTAVIMIKESHVPAVLLAGHRVLLAAAILTPFFLVTLKKHPQWRKRDLLRGAAPGAVMLALHFMSWTIGARMTGAANATLVVNMVPVVMPFMLWLGAGELISRREIVGSLLALAGMLVLTAGDYHLDRATLVGDGVCFVSMLLVAIYLIAAKRARRGGLPLWLYIVPLYWMAGLLCFAVALFVPSARPVFDHSLREYAILLYLAAVPTVIGHTMLNYAMQHLRGQVVSIFNLGQFIFAGILAYAFRNEVPGNRFYLASVLVVAGGIIVVMRTKPSVEKLQKEAALIED